MKIMRKLILGAVSTGFVAIALAATTYAWYKLGNVAFADEFEFNASTTEGFLVSVDGINYKHKLSTTDMVKAMIIGKNPNDYEFAKDGSLIDVRNGNVKLNDEKLSEAYLKALALEPVTSYDGRVMKGLSGGVINEANDYSSKYVYFNLYFQTVTEKKSKNGKEEYKKYEIYLDGLGYDDGHNTAAKTEIWSDKATNVKLVAPMTVWNGTPDGLTYQKGDTIQVYTANASRLSAQNLGYLQKYQIVDLDAPFNSELKYFTREGEGTEESPYVYSQVEINEFEEGTTYYTEIEEKNLNISDKPKGNALIYELSSNSDADLGSFATNYSGDDQTLNRLYNCNYNAMYTYYNNVKTEDKLDTKIPNYESDLPSTIRSLVTKDNEGNSINRKDVIATVESGQITKVGFRFWIEGWDGDCFDGLPGYYDNVYKLYEDEFNPELTYYTKVDEETYIKAITPEDGFEEGKTYYVIDGLEEKEVNPINARLLFNSIKVD